MMAGWGSFGPLEMGGMFSVVMVRDGLPSDQYSHPGWYKNPEGTVAYEWKGELPKTARANTAQTQYPSKNPTKDS